MQDKDIPIEDALSSLINLSGKMRMLSHRLAMAGLQAVHAGDRRAVALYKSALTEFEEIWETLRRGSPAFGIPKEAALLLAQTGALPQEDVETVSRFLREAQQMALTLEDKERSTCGNSFSELVYFVAEDVLGALNRITEGVGQTLKGCLEERSEKERQSRDTMLAAARAVSEVSAKVKLISLNATIEAAHAGDSGKGFAVIANEIRSLSEDAARSTAQIMKHLDHTG
jgi:methyl-accepting chemotaxis protein